MFLYSVPNSDVVLAMMNALVEEYGFTHAELFQGSAVWYMRQIEDGPDRAAMEALTKGA